jgi:hypothetical protein
MEGESCWKSGGGRTRLYTWPRVGLADEAGSDAIPNAVTGPLHRMWQVTGIQIAICQKIILSRPRLERCWPWRRPRVFMKH